MTLTDKQKQDIEQEAEKYWPAAVAFGEKARRAYIAGATARALACIQKDEEIAALRVALGRCKRLCNEDMSKSERLQLILETATEALKQST